MSSLPDSIHRRSSSIQYSDYSSGEDAPEPDQDPSPAPKKEEDEDESSSSSTYEDTMQQIEANKQNTKKRVSQKILDKLSAFSPLADNDNDDDKQLEIIQSRSRKDSESGGISRKEKKTKLSEQWLSKMNQSQPSLHESQKPLHEKEQTDFENEHKKLQIKQQNDNEQKEQNKELKDCLKQHFIFDHGHIFSAESMRLYLEEKSIQTNDNDLDDCLVEMFGDKVKNEWGYYLRLLT